MKHSCLRLSLCRVCGDRDFPFEGAAGMAGTKINKLSYYRIPNPSFMYNLMITAFIRMT